MYKQLPLAVLLILLVGFNSLSANWFAATSTPPTSNVPAPINTGTTTQAKLGNFTAAIVGASTEVRANRYCDALGNNCTTPSGGWFGGGFGFGGDTVPAGSVFHIAGTVAPTGYLIANGQAVSRATYPVLFGVIGTRYGAGDGSTTFNLPDLRGEFIRGWDAGRGVDPGRSFGTWQADEFRSHAHLDNMFQQSHLYDGNVSGTYRAAFPTGRHVNMWTSSAGGAETRPRNVALLPIIKF